MNRIRGKKPLLCTIGLIGLVVMCGCGDEGSKSGSGSGTLVFQLKSAPADVQGFLFKVYAKQSLVLERYSNGALPQQAPASNAAERAFGATFLVAPGQYKISAQPMQAPTLPSVVCQMVEANVEVVGGKSTEVALVFQCNSTGPVVPGAIPGVTTGNAIGNNGNINPGNPAGVSEVTNPPVVSEGANPPAISALTYVPMNVVDPCQDMDVKVAVPQAGARILFEITAAPAQAAYTTEVWSETLHFNARTAGWYSGRVTVCTEGGCSSTTFQVQVGLSQDFNRNGISDFCEGQGKGKEVTILLTLTNPRITESRPDKNIAAQIIQNAVDFVSPVGNPSILVVRDDNHQNEFADDPMVIFGLMLNLGYRAEFAEEPLAGLSFEQVSRFDVIWFSNPGQPVNHLSSMQALQRFMSERGGGVVLQGDDMSRSLLVGAAMEQLTGLQNVDNGESFCGVLTNNNLGANYRVTMSDGAHPMTRNLQGETFLYGDDIDTSCALNRGEKVLAWADLGSRHLGHCGRKPVIVAYDPSDRQ